MPITIEQVLTAAKTAIRADAAIAAFCSAEYSSTLKIFVGEDDTAPPEESDAPYVVLAPPLPNRPYDIGSGTEYRRPGLEVQWGIVRKANPAAASGSTGITLEDSGNTKIFDGQMECDQLGMLLFAALVTAFTAEKLQVVNYDVGLHAPPLWEGGMSITLVYFIGLGSEPTAP
jgi:hypothetical protein